ncbi:MAG: tetratricopeptide repeat protein [Myxococcota bacterium]|nr:tetratricopeptide repeat protein [Myxococcota bacterium]
MKIAGHYCLLLLISVGCAGAIPENREAAFTYAVDQLQSGRPEAASSAAWRYVKGATTEDPRYDRALRLLARSAEQMGLTYAAAQWFRDIAQGRREPELMSEAIGGLKIIIESGAFDEDALVDGFLATAEIEGLPEDLQAFIRYYQGLNDARHLKQRWAADNFAKIPTNSPYAARAEYVRAVEAIARRQFKDATERLEALEKKTDLPADLASTVRRSLARLSAKAGLFEDAIQRYEQLRQDAPGDPELLLEMAWVNYDRGDVRRALGLLLALDAPIYADLIAPERFLLEALALRRLCQFGPARRAATRLRAKHGNALADIYAGVSLTSSRAIRDAARRRTPMKTLSAFYTRVSREQKMLDDLGVSQPLLLHLKQMYTRGVQEAKRGFESALAVEVDILASELLAAEEGVNLILHELGVGLLRGRNRSPGAPLRPAPEVTTGDRRSFFRFQGEFWTDELDDLVVVAEDRCID